MPSTTIPTKEENSVANATRAKDSVALSPPPPPPSSTCQSLLLIRRRFWSRLLERYTTAMSSSLHRDRLLKTLCYALWWVGHFAKRPEHQKAAQTLYADILWARYLTRAVEWPTAWEGVVNDSWIPSWAIKSDGDDRDTRKSSSSSSSSTRTIGRVLGRILATSMVVYYPAELLAYGYWKVLPTKMSAQQRWAEKFSAWSCRAWLVYILTDLVQGYLALTTTTTTANDDNNQNLAKQQQLVRHKQKVVMARNLLFLLPAYNWSLPDWDTKPWLKSTTVNFFMVLEAFLSLYQSTLEVQ